MMWCITRRSTCSSSAKRNRVARTSGPGHLLAARHGGERHGLRSLLICHDDSSGANEIFVDRHHVIERAEQLHEVWPHPELLLEAIGEHGGQERIASDVNEMILRLH